MTCNYHSHFDGCYCCCFCSCFDFHSVRNLINEISNVIHFFIQFGCVSRDANETAKCDIDDDEVRFKFHRVSILKQLSVWFFAIKVSTSNVNINKNKLHRSKSVFPIKTTYNSRKAKLTIIIYTQLMTVPHSI